MRMAVTLVLARSDADQRRDDLDGTNNACERLIGWWIKERYRAMRVQTHRSIRNVVTLTALIGAHRPDLAALVERTLDDFLRARTFPIL